MSTFTAEQKLALIKHLAGGKPAEIVATIMHTTKDDVIEVARHHGYPDTDKLAWAADIMTKKLEEGDALPERPLAVGAVERPRAVVPGPQPIATKADEALSMLNAARSHQSKRVQAAALKALEAIAKVRTMLAEDELKHSAKRKADAEKAAARAEVERLQKQLAAAKAKLRGEPATAATEDGEHPCADCGRTFGSAHGLGVHVGRAHGEQAAS